MWLFSLKSLSCAGARNAWDAIRLQPVGTREQRADFSKSK
jgi:hypothetical protein